MTLLEVEDLTVRIDTEFGTVHAVNGISLSVERGETLAIVGESGCGKSITGLSLARLLPEPAARIAGGTIRFEGIDLVTASPRTLADLRGRDVAMIFQDPMSTLNPVLTIGEQMAEALLRGNYGVSIRPVRDRLLELLDMVGLPGGEAMLRRYPHQLSGGMRQRVMIAMALAQKPRLLIADEPTTGLDVTVEAQILDLVGRLTEESETAVILITHDLGVVAGVSRRVAVMYCGTVIETAPTDTLFDAPMHPYTVGLLHATPSIDADADEDLLAIEGVPPNQLRPPAGCPFAPRCAWRQERCWVEVPQPRAVGEQHQVACHNTATREEAQQGRPARLAPAPPPPNLFGIGEVVTFRGVST
ncbi:ABC transporter ATP-binding protein [Acuticoccus mangrovi]|uniref:ABC transporter ATP-binding protein n=1 Tax=Acuticoccus mangrovi TaxID=2796142 RepID=A0A934IHX0_9HYPH|nr:ABC transporter ATP-binding protein [Acuticoccus mangrovi]MBJ3777019.1 ABC transporter ATP-binding protein [Acuticoccus mangrovi]